MNGFAVEQIEEIKQGSASFDTQLDALVKLAKDVTVKRGKPNQTLLKNFFEAGFDKEHLIDTLIVIGDTTISNLVNCVAQTPIDDQWLLSLTDTHASGRNISSKSNQTGWILEFRRETLDICVIFWTLDTRCWMLYLSIKRFIINNL